MELSRFYQTSVTIYQLEGRNNEGEVNVINSAVVAPNIARVTSLCVSANRQSGGYQCFGVLCCFIVQGQVNTLKIEATS